MRIALGLSLALALAAPAQTGPVRFRNVTEAAGVRFLHTDGSSGRRYVVETVSGALGLIDYDGDGYLDIYFLNGIPLPGTPKPDRMPTCELYHNNRDGTFTDVTAKSGAGISAYAMGCTVADYDNDGHEDIFVTTYGGPHHLLRNNGNGTFTDVTEKGGLGKASGPGYVGAGCAFVDYDRDGYLDLFIGHYLEFDPAVHKACVRKNVPGYCSPAEYPMVPNRLYHNNRDGTFTDVSEPSGIGRHKSYAMGIVCADFDGDGWPDIYVGNDVSENFLFHNRKNGTFEEIAVPAGVAVDLYGDPQGTMGVNVGDYDGDGRLDIIVTDYQDQAHHPLSQPGQPAIPGRDRSDGGRERIAAPGEVGLRPGGLRQRQRAGAVHCGRASAGQRGRLRQEHQLQAAQPALPAARRALCGCHRPERGHPGHDRKQPRGGVWGSEQRRPDRPRGSERPGPGRRPPQ